MGADKATLEFKGRPLIAHAIAILLDAGLPVSIAGNRPDLKKLAPTNNDLGFSRGPLGGICGAFQVTSAPAAVFVPVDLPLLPSALITVMLKVAQVTGHAVVVPSLNGFAQTFPVVLSRAALPVLVSELEAGRGGCFSAFKEAAKALGQKVHVVCSEMLAQSGQVQHADGLPTAQWFLNINSDADLRRALAFRTGKVGESG